MNKRLRFDTDEDDVTVPANPSDLAVELDNTKKLLNFAQLESRQKSETITDLNNQIVRMQQHLEDQEIEIEGLNDLQTSGPRVQPESIIECQRFRTYLRSNGFLNPMDTRTVCQSLGGEHELSEDLKNFTYLAKQARRKFIKVFINKNRSPLLGQYRLRKRKKEHKKVKKYDQSRNFAEDRYPSRTTCRKIFRLIITVRKTK